MTTAVVAVAEDLEVSDVCVVLTQFPFRFMEPQTSQNICIRLCPGPLISQVQQKFIYYFILNIGNLQKTSLPLNHEVKKLMVLWDDSVLACITAVIAGNDNKQ